MSRKALVLTLSTLVFLAEAGCVTENLPTTCSVTGARHLSADASSADICRKFEERLVDAMAAAGKTVDPAALTVSIDLHERGSAEALISRRGQDETTEYPKVSVDVMDRPLAQGDLDRLAAAVAQVMLQAQPAAGT